MVLARWNELPYLTEPQFEKVLQDLPEAHEPGRSGRSAGEKVASSCVVLGPRACAARLPKDSESAAEKFEPLSEQSKDITQPVGGGVADSKPTTSPQRRLGESDH